MGKFISLESYGDQISIEGDEDAQIQGEGLQQIIPVDHIQKGPQTMLNVVTPFWNALLKTFDAASRSQDVILLKSGLDYQGKEKRLVVKIIGELCIRVTLQWQAA